MTEGTGARGCLARVLVVDDEAAIGELVAGLLQAEGIDCIACCGGADALALFERERFDLAILDVMMPGMDGFELCARLRAMSDVPIMFLSARDEETDQVVGFTLGSDDYVAKPFKPRELVARVKARLRRASSREIASDHVVRARGIEIDERAHKASLHDVELALTPKEFAILTLLVKRAGSPVSTREIFETVWRDPYDASASNTVMVHIRHVRRKLAAVDSSTSFIETAWGVGYRIASDGDAPSGRGGSVR